MRFELFMIILTSSIIQAFNNQHIPEQNIMKNEDENLNTNCLNSNHTDLNDLNILLNKEALRTHLIILKNESMLRLDKLEQFLIAKSFKYSEKINTMLVPEHRNIFEKPIPILKSNTDYYMNKNPNSKMTGTDSCSLERVAYERYKTPVPICPWRWIVTIRDDRYPFKRANAKCNCVNCQAKTIYDSDLGKLSSCKTETILMPVLFRESFKNETEKWVFYLEEVPVSCVCSIRLNPVF